MFIDPNTIIDDLNLSSNEVIIDLGTGSGIYSIEIAKRLLGTGGLVYAVDIQQNVLTRLAHTAKEMNLHNIHFIHSDIEKVNGVQLKSNSGNLVIVSNVLSTSEFKSEILQESKRLTCEGGQLLIIDWKDSKRKFGPRIDNSFTENACLKLAMEYGFSLDRVLFAGPHHFALLMHKNISHQE